VACVCGPVDFFQSGSVDDWEDMCSQAMVLTFFIGFVQALVAAACNFLFAYMILTIVVTLWRKKFRKQVAISDNDWHDRCTDSLVNFETVKYVHSLSRAAPC
jgi:ABC-type transport system involved in Fe-S cluster assembly fused permease/ATPase subunit